MDSRGRAPSEAGIRIKLQPLTKKYLSSGKVGEVFNFSFLQEIVYMLDKHEEGITYLESRNCGLSNDMQYMGFGFILMEKCLTGKVGEVLTSPDFPGTNDHPDNETSPQRYEQIVKDLINYVSFKHLYSARYAGQRDGSLLVQVLLIQPWVFFLSVRLK